MKIAVRMKWVLVASISGLSLLFSTAFPGAAGRALAADSVTINESAVNELAAAMGTFKAHGRQVIKAAGIVICGKWKADLKNLKFDIKPSGVFITGDVSARYHCNAWIPFSASLTSTGYVTYDAARHVIRITTSATNIQPYFDVDVFGYRGRVYLPFTINAAAPLSFSFPINTARFFFETAGGPENLRVTPHNIDLDMEDGYIRIQSDVTLW